MSRIRSVSWKTSMMLICLGFLWPAVSSAATCRTQIPSLGGSTAIYRGKPLDSVAELQKALKSEKTYKAFQETFAAAHLESRFQEVMDIISRMQEHRQKILWTPHSVRVDGISSPVGQESPSPEEFLLGRRQGL